MGCRLLCACAQLGAGTGVVCKSCGLTHFHFLYPRSAFSPKKLMSTFEAPDDNVFTLYDNWETAIARYPHVSAVLLYLVERTEHCLPASNTASDQTAIPCVNGDCTMPQCHQAKHWLLVYLLTTW